MYGMLQKGQPAMGTRSRQAKAVVKTVSTALCQILCLCKAPFQMVTWWSGTSMKMYEDVWRCMKYIEVWYGFNGVHMCGSCSLGSSRHLLHIESTNDSPRVWIFQQCMTAHCMTWHDMHGTWQRCNAVQRGATLWPLRCWWIWSGWLSWTCPNQRTWATERQFSDERLSRA